MVDYVGMFGTCKMKGVGCNLFLYSFFKALKVSGFLFAIWTEHLSFNWETYTLNESN